MRIKKDNGLYQICAFKKTQFDGWLHCARRHTAVLKSQSKPLFLYSLVWFFLPIRKGHAAL